MLLPEVSPLAAPDAVLVDAAAALATAVVLERGAATAEALGDVAASEEPASLEEVLLPLPTVIVDEPEL